MANFDPNIPQSTDFLSASQGDLLNNNQQLDAVMDVNHYKFSLGVGAGAGKHKFVTLVDQSAPSTGSGEMAVWNTGDKLYARASNDGTPYELAGSALNANPGYIQLPSGIRMQWGVAVIPAGQTTAAVLFSGLGLPDFSAPPYTVQATPYNSPITGSSPREIGVTQASLATTGFTVISFNGPVPAITNIGWLAIGAV